MAYAIRRARPPEHQLLAAIERNAGKLFATVGLNDIAEAKPASFEFIDAFARSGAVFVAVQEADDTPVGFALVGFLDAAAHIYELSVAETHGRQGLGRRLVEEACRFAAAEGKPAVTLSTFRDVAWNGPFYERMGFRYLGRNEWTPALHLLHYREIADGLPVDRRAFMRKELP